MNTEEMQDLLDRAVRRSKADQTEIVAVEQSTGTTRFSNSEIHQNMAERSVFLSVRVAQGNRLGWASNHSLTDEAVRASLDLSLEIASQQQPDPYFKSLPAPTNEVNMAAPFFPKTLNCSPKARAGLVQQILDEAEQRGLSAAGTVETGGGLFGIANSLGIRAVTPVSESSAQTVIMRNEGSGYASQISPNIDTIDGKRIGRVASLKAADSENPEDVPSGVYTVILEPAAVAEMIGWLGLSGLGALSVQEGRSFMCDRFGQQIVGENITLWDDGRDKRMLGLPFDFEGVPKERVTLIEDGIAKNVVYDSYTGAKEGRNSTGHALPAPNTYGPLPLNIIMKPGDATQQEMITGTKRGILVTRFHYTNLENPTQAIITGMTRDGTFLIENGCIQKAVKNLRFTQSILGALNNVEAIGPNLEAKEVFGGGIYLVPALKIGQFNITGLSTQ